MVKLMEVLFNLYIKFCEKIHYSFVLLGYGVILGTQDYDLSRPFSIVKNW